MASRAAGLAEVVRAAALHDTSLDTGGVLWLEHVNLVVGNRAQAERFYVAFLGCTADPSPSFHVNLGRQQFHLSEGDAQLLTGSFGIAVPSLDTVRSRAAEAAAALHGTHFAFHDHGHALEATCPWGNTFFVYAMAVPAEAQAGTADDAPKLVRRQAGFDQGMGVLGDQPGIRFLEVRVPPGAARRVGRFYEEVLGAHVVYDAEGKLTLTLTLTLTTTLSLTPTLTLTLTRQRRGGGTRPERSCPLHRHPWAERGRAGADAGRPPLHLHRGLQAGVRAAAGAWSHLDQPALRTPRHVRHVGASQREPTVPLPSDLRP